MSGCEATDEVKQIIRAMAKAKLEEGVTDAHDIVDAIHETIKDHTPLWKNEIADIISGYGKTRERAPTRTELQERLIQLKRDLKEAYHPKPSPRSAEEVANQRRQTQIRNEIERIKEQIRAGNFEKPERKPPQYDDTTRKMEADLAAARRQADRLMAKLEYQNKSRAAKIGDTLLAFHRAMILSGFHTLEHLSGAALARLFFSPIEQLAGAVLHHVPGIRAISEKAPTEGGGFGAGALVEGYKHGLGKQTLIDMRDKVLRGFSDLQAVHKAPLDSNHPILELVGHIHDALKTPAENFAYAKAIYTHAQQTRAALARSGMAPEAIDRAMLDPAMQARAEALAFGESQRAKLQADNKVVNAFRAAVGIIGNAGTAGKLAAGVINYEMPIIKIPTNLVDEVGSYAAGGIRAVLEAINHAPGKMTPEAADYIMRNLKKGLVGKALAVIAWLGYEAFGGEYDPNRHRHAGEPEYETIRVDGHTIPKALLHSPAWTYMQGVALARRVFESEMDKSVRKSEAAKPVAAAGTAALQSSRAVAQAIPFVEEPADFWNAIKDSSSFGDYVGKQVASNIPQALKDVAKATDPESALKRHPSGFMQQIESGIPGLREHVPLQALKHMTLDAKLEAYDKMSPEERDKTGILDSINLTAEHSRTITDEQRKRVEEINR